MRIPFRIPSFEVKAFDVVGIGQNSVDLLAVVAEYPQAGTKQRIQRIARLPGGQIATAMVVCSRLGWRASYIGTFGDDDLGRLSRESLVSEKVDVGAAWTVPGSSNQFAIIIVDARSGDRTIVWDRHPALTIDPRLVPEHKIISARMLLVDCDDAAAAAQAAKFARAAGIPTVVDVEKVRPGLNEVLANADAIIAAENFPIELTGYEDIGRALEAMAHEFAAPVVAVTLGSKGSLARAGGREIRTSAFEIDCVDTTGAGDAFHGGFVAACLQAADRDLEGALEYANAVAALNCRALGARDAIPTAEEVERLLSR